MTLMKYVAHPKLAFRKLARITRNLYWDVRFGGLCGRFRYRPSPFAHLGAGATWSSEYGYLSILFERVKINDSDVLVDVGCGQGRVLNYWLSLGLPNRLIGIELDPRVAEQARRRLRKYSNVTVVTGDALEHVPEDGTIFYLYSPFNRQVMERFQSRILEVTAERDNVSIIYFNCVALDAFARDARWVLERLEPEAHGTYFPAAIIRKRAPVPAPCQSC
jgi:SAM-dependent methyltransferase